MSVMSDDDSITVASDGGISSSNSFSLQQSQRKKTCPRYKRIPGEILNIAMFFIFCIYLALLNFIKVLIIHTYKNVIKCHVILNLFAGW